MSWPQELLSPQDQQQLETQHYLFQQQQAQFSQQYEHFQQYIQQPQPQPQPQLEFQQSTQQQLHFVDIPTESTTTGPFQTIRTEDLSHPPEPVVSHFSAVNHGLATPQPFFNQSTTTIPYGSPVVPSTPTTGRNRSASSRAPVRHDPYSKTTRRSGSKAAVPQQRSSQPNSPIAPSPLANEVDFAPAQGTSAYAEQPALIHPPEAITRSIEQIMNTTYNSLGRRACLFFRCDGYYAYGNNELIFFLETPGVGKDGLKITLSTNVVSRVRQVIISATLKPAFPGGVSGAPSQGEASSSMSFCERKFGEYHRVLTVPDSTRAEDVKASLKDGVTMVQIYTGEPALSEDIVQIPIQ